MSSLNLPQFAEHIANSNNIQAMLPVVEKELLHYEILGALDRADLLSNLTFQGGTCLRLCYGALRYSEDLDFAGGTDFDFESLHAIKEVLESSLDKRYAIETTVSESAKKTDETGITIKKWKVKVVTAPERPDIPMQRISLEIATVPAHARTVKALKVNYEELPNSYGNTLLYTETLEEICADKLKAFLTASHLRYRDLWDMNWLTQRPNFDHSKLPSLFDQKLIDYGETKTAQNNHQRIVDVPAILNSREFLDQMRRFIPATTLQETLERPMFREVMANNLTELYQLALYGERI